MRATISTVRSRPAALVASVGRPAVAAVGLAGLTTGFFLWYELALRGPHDATFLDVSFVVGLLVSNATIAALAACGYLTSARHSAAYIAVSIATALFSAAVGTLFILGSAGTLPSILGG